MASKDRLRRVLIATAAVLAAGGLYVLAIRLLGRGLYCPVWSLTGLYCPGCGVSRMCLRLLRLDLAGALRANPLLLIALPGLLALAARHLTRYVKTGQGRGPKWEERTWLALAALFVVYGALRNLPGLSFLAPV